jgi:DNA-binding NtrC family response regulator
LKIERSQKEAKVKPPRILSVSYDEPILRTRQYVLEEAGFEVVSALGFADAAKLTQGGHYDLLLVGHTLPHNDKTALIRMARQHCDCAVVSIYKHGMPAHPDADFAVDSNDGPRALIAAVKAALKKS